MLVVPVAVGIDSPDVPNAYPYRETPYIESKDEEKVLDGVLGDIVRDNRLRQSDTRFEVSNLNNS
ncbi:hypothetical protein GCM10007415_00070 [Parapedobacter pyrenivorans]|uniref:Uncharacterized protein n=1 Tax=Parapedobacter pyrenivorans TaxID=1305674 RepID=A0A917M1A5_9SPHI|nr:hypothetical protein [Parapedobacter pyrenivorans]GGG72765.1 hypothetical protein GCM10007415_00070 [Parapedobacter pyrenivorans]